MSESSSTNSQAEIYRHLIAVTRKVAKTHGLQRLGVEHFSASLVRVLGQTASPILAASGIAVVDMVLLRIPDATLAEGEALPPVIADDNLTKLLKGPLSGLAKGLMPPQDALGILLSEQETASKLKKLVEGDNLSRSEQRLPKATIKTLQVKGPDAQTAIRKFTKVLQSGYQLSQRRYGLAEKRGTSDFATGCCDSEFAKVLAEWESEMLECRMLLYGGPRIGNRSYFDRTMREFGPVAADILAAVTMHSVTPFTDRDAGILVRDLAWILKPRFPHSYIPAVLEATKALADAKYVRILPEPESCQLESYLLPTEETLLALGKYLE